MNARRRPEGRVDSPDEDLLPEDLLPDRRRGPRPGGRSARVREAVLRAAFDVLTEHGADAFTIAEVAARAGVHETSIYRRWGTPAALALEASLVFVNVALPIPDTGHLRSDLVALLDSLVALLSSPQGRAFLALSTSQNPHAVASRRRFTQRRVEMMRTMFDKAVKRGEFPADYDPMIMMEALIAPLYLRVLVTGEPLQEWPRQEMVDRLLGSFLRPR